VLELRAAVGGRALTQERIDGRLVDVVDGDCAFRPCFVLGFDKGPFTPGVGYTSYYPGGARAVCWNRHMNGCPHIGAHLKCGDCHQTLGDVVLNDDEREKPDACPECGGTDLYWLADVLPEPELCCGNVDLAKPRGRPYSQRCRSCGTKLSGRRLELAQAVEH
jgi:DNA-directed RNA polymerase subunit RPC12/RpoP